MSLGGVLVLTSSNKDKQAGITVVVHERREETREKRRDSWKRSSRVFEGDYFEAVEEHFGGDSIVDVQIAIVEIKFSYIKPIYLLSFIAFCSSLLAEPSNPISRPRIRQQTTRLHNTIYISSLVSSHDHGSFEDAEV